MTMIGRTALSMAAAKRLGDPTSELLSRTDVFIFDCDGVIWKGDSVIPGIPDVLDKVRLL
jgi:phosphoglycolate phosphatase